MPKQTCRFSHLREGEFYRLSHEYYAILPQEVFDKVTATDRGYYKVKRTKDGNIFFTICAGPRTYVVQGSITKTHTLPNYYTVITAQEFFEAAGGWESVFSR